MPPDEASMAFLVHMATSGMPPPETLSPTELRSLPPPPQAFVGDLRPIGDQARLQIPPGATNDAALDARIYHPCRSGRAPLIVYFHGGGWVRGSSDRAAPIIRELCAELSAVVLSVEYRLAPEHKFPTPFLDSWAGLRYAVDHSLDLGGDGRIIVAGDSAGGNLAAAVTLRSLWGNGPPIHHLLLIYPVLDRNFETSSYRQFASGHHLTKSLMEYYWRHYLRDEADGANPFASPLRAPNLTGSPPTTVITAECDPLRDEGEAYVRRLVEAGVDAVELRCQGALHGFCALPGAFEKGKKAVRAAAARVADSLRANRSVRDVPYDHRSE